MTKKNATRGQSCCILRTLCQELRMVKGEMGRRARCSTDGGRWGQGRWPLSVNAAFQRPLSPNPGLPPLAPSAGLEPAPPAPEVDLGRPQRLSRKPQCP